jgi:hypothetical protein
MLSETFPDGNAKKDGQVGGFQDSPKFQLKICFSWG